MSRGGSSRGGQSSLGYLFEQDENNPSSIKPTTKPQKPQLIEDAKNKPAKEATAPTKPISNNYQRAQGQNSGNFITGRSSTKVLSVPGGCSSLGYLFGDK
ncbi:protein SPIRAL1-like 5 [Ananas comosus]|uniref:Protein SPIRAL1-like 5 n=1 Tax=Ananas comosus TaxID=4615 RepID=A0A6P5ES25_ANACO|nr:protein SPIRAL1-like 5 [Ananas comosus]